MGSSELLNSSYDLYKASIVSVGITAVFAEVMQTRKISLTDWHEVLTAPLRNLEGEYECNLILITQLISAVRQEIVKVVDEEKEEQSSYHDLSVLSQPRQKLSFDFETEKRRV